MIGITSRAIFAILLYLIFLELGCLREAPSEIKKTVDAGRTDAGDIVVVATNDFHAALDRAEGLASIIRDLRKRYGPSMVYLDAGDQFQGSLEGNISKGRAVVEFFDLLGLDAAAVGNHEFDYGPDVPGRTTVKPGEDGMGTLKYRAKHAKYPFLSANLIVDPPVSCGPGPRCNALGQTTIFEPRIVIQRNSQKVCVIGVTTPLTAEITNPSFLKGARFEELKPVTEAEAKLLRSKEKCDWVLLTAHEGLRYERDGKTFKNSGLLPLLNQLLPQTVDAVVGGHSHIQVQEVIRGTPVIQTGIGARVVGVLHLFGRDGKKMFRFDPFVSVPDTAVAFDVTKLLGMYRRTALEFKRKVTGKTAEPFLLNKTVETALGNLVADALLDAGRQLGPADFALMNAGGIRTSLPKGTLTYDHVFKLMPFDDDLVTVELTGTELRTLLEIAFSGALGMPSVSGLQITRLDVNSTQAGPWDRDLNKDGKKEEWERNLVTDFRDTVGNSLHSQKTYALTTISYLVEGGDYQDFVYAGIPDSRIHLHSEMLIRDVLAKYFKKRSPLNPPGYFSASKPRIKLIRPS